MARMASKVTREFDAAAQVTLRDIDDGAETADASETGVALNLLTDAYWDNDEQADGKVVVSIHVSAIDFTTLDEVYDIYVEVDTASGFPSAKEVARLFRVPGVGYYEIVVPTRLVEALEVGATHIRARLDVGGTTPSITYGAWMTYQGV
jgi:hypothetical protein